MLVDFSALPKRLPKPCRRIRLNGARNGKMPSAMIAASAHEVSPAGRRAVLLANTSMPGIRELSLDSPAGTERANPADRLQRNDSPKAPDRPVIQIPRERGGGPALALQGCAERTPPDVSRETFRILRHPHRHDVPANAEALFRTHLNREICRSREPHSQAWTIIHRPRNVGLARFRHGFDD